MNCHELPLEAAFAEQRHVSGSVPSGGRPPAFPPQNASIAQWPTPVATDNDRVANLTATRRSGEVFQGRTNVTYTAVDPSGVGDVCPPWMGGWAGVLLAMYAWYTSVSRSKGAGT